MLILLTNDDGLYAAGLAALKDALTDLGDVWAVAPAVEQSGVSHAFSITGPLRSEKVVLNGKVYGYSISGTPVDTVKLALGEILPEPPALVVSGINLGENTGINILYSGTVAAAMEGTALGIPSIAVSLATFRSPDYSFTAEFTRKLCRKLPKLQLPADTLLNVNVPVLKRDQIRGVKITCQADSHYDEEIERRLDPRSREYYWIGGRNVLDSKGNDNDMAAVRNGYVSITPLKINQTNHNLIPVLEELQLD